MFKVKGQVHSVK